MPIDQVWQAASVILIVVSGVLAKSYRSGWIHHRLESPSQLDEIHETTRETHRELGEVNQKVDRIGEAMVVLHEDDEDVNTDALRRHVGVSGMAGDIKDD